MIIKILIYNNMNKILFNIILLFLIGILIIYILNIYPKIIMQRKNKPDNYNNIYVNCYKM